MDEANANAGQEVTLNKLAADFKVVLQDAESLIKATAGDLGERAREARSRLAASLETAKTNCQKMQGEAVERAKAADQLVREHPYESLGIAFGVGLLLGLLVSRK